MNLKAHLLLQIVIAAILCLAVTAAYVLYQTNQQVRQELGITLDNIYKYLAIQMVQVDANLIDRHHFPDFELWKESHSTEGVCIRYISSSRELAYGLCLGESLGGNGSPAIFEKLYRKAFNPGAELARPLKFKDEDFGVIVVIPSVDKELARAWERLTGLLGLSASITLAVCLLVYIAIYRALRPAQIIVANLETMQTTDAVQNLPNFKLIEWQRIGAAINDFVATQKQLLSERKKLALALMLVQEEERRYLARELHDELGQCLAAINALSSSIVQTAKQDCPHLVAEAESIANINQRIMHTVRTLLLRLRPAELDELGLSASLDTMVADWNRQCAGRINCRLSIEGDCQGLQAPLPITLYRIVQEGLTNIAKHSSATQAAVALAIANDRITLTIEDNGRLATFPPVSGRGIGLVGIRERINGLGGLLELAAGKAGGLALQITLPVAMAKDNSL